MKLILASAVELRLSEAPCSPKAITKSKGSSSSRIGITVSQTVIWFPLSQLKTFFVFLKTIYLKADSIFHFLEGILLLGVPTLTRYRRQSASCLKRKGHGREGLSSLLTALGNSQSFLSNENNDGSSLPFFIGTLGGLAIGGYSFFIEASNIEIKT